MESNVVDNEVNATSGTATANPVAEKVFKALDNDLREANSDFSEVGKSDQYVWGAIACYLIFYKKGDVSTTLGSFILVSLWLNKK